MDRTLPLLVAMSVSLTSVALGQISIPKTRLGYVFNGGSNNAPVSLDLHMCLLCDDSRDAFPVAKQVAMHYGADKLRLTMHMFPLPYHHEAFYTAIGAKAVLNLASVGAVYEWFEIIYDNLDKLSNNATMDMTTTQVLAQLADFAEEAGVNRQQFLSTIAISELGTESMIRYYPPLNWAKNGQLADFAEEVGVNRSQFLSTIAIKELDTECRTAWKYSCSRAVFGTPTFFVNDVQVAADPKWTLADWMQVIDPLLQEEVEVSENKVLADTCPAGKKNCDYLPGKMECCHDAENCIFNVGCRRVGDSCENENEEPNKACPTGTTLCKYIPGKEECCPVSENCIPNVGCRCFDSNGEPCANQKLLKDEPEIEEEPAAKPLV